MNTALSAFLGSVAGSVLTLVITHWTSYFQKKGENLATHEDIQMILEQVKATTRVTKEIEAKISTDVWDRQKRWELKRDAIFSVAKELGSLEDALIGLHSAYTVAKKQEQANDFVAMQSKTNALSVWSKTQNSFDLANVEIQLVCGEEVKNAVANASMAMRITGNKITKGDTESFHQDLPTIVAAGKNVMKALREELGGKS